MQGLPEVRRGERRGDAGGRIVEFLVNPQHPPPPEFRRNRRGIKRSVASARTKYREDILLATCGPTRQAPGCVQTNSKGSSHLFPFPVLYSWATRQGLPFEKWFAQPSTHYATVTPSSQTCRRLNFTSVPWGRLQRRAKAGETQGLFVFFRMISLRFVTTLRFCKLKVIQPLSYFRIRYGFDPAPTYPPRAYLKTVSANGIMSDHAGPCRLRQGVSMLLVLVSRYDSGLAASGMQSLKFYARKSCN